MTKDVSSVRRAATRRLRELALKAKDGDFLGSEQELIAFLDVSRPTFRQVARLLEHEQLIAVKMGPAGGCYARRPEIESVARVAATYLQGEPSTLHEMLGVSHMLVLQTVRLASACTDERKREALGKIIRTLEAQPENLSIPAFLAFQSEFNAAIRAMAMNSTLDLFQRVVERFLDLNPSAKALMANDDLRRGRRRYWIALAAALLDHDRTHAEDLATQQLDIYMSLMPLEALAKAAIGRETVLDPIML